MGKDYEVCYSATVDYLRWTCPKCDTENERSGDENIFDTCCSNCGYDLENDFTVPQVMDDIETATCYDDED